MMLAFLSVIVCIMLFVGLFVFFPIWHPPENPSGTEKEFQAYQSLVHEQDIVFENLKELELDRQMQKLSEEDYQRLKTQLMSEALDASRKIEAFEKASSILQSIEQDLRMVKG